MKLLNSDQQKQIVNFKVYKHTDTTRIAAILNVDISSGNNYILELDSSIKYDVLTTPRGICPKAIVTTDSVSSDEQVTTWDNQKHITDSSIFIAIT